MSALIETPQPTADAPVADTPAEVVFTKELIEQITRHEELSPEAHNQRVVLRQLAREAGFRIPIWHHVMDFNHDFGATNHYQHHRNLAAKAAKEQNNG